VPDGTQRLTEYRRGLGVDNAAEKRRAQFGLRYEEIEWRADRNFRQPMMTGSTARIVGDIER
jgi:hypothetical protein